MLSIAKAHKDHYLQKVGEISPREDYYLRGGTAAGRWHRSGATERGTQAPQGMPLSTGHSGTTRTKAYPTRPPTSSGRSHPAATSTDALRGSQPVAPSRAIYEA